ncbi:MAG: hypothetical protein ABI892_03180 [Flavobacterium sp.]
MSRRHRKNKIKLSTKKELIVFIIKVLSIPLSLISFIYLTRQYNNFIIIKFEFVLYIYIISGLAFGFLFYKYEKKKEGKNFKILEHFSLILLIYGSISCTVFLIANEYLSTNKEYKILSPIIAKHESYKRSPNSITVNIEGTEREINIHNCDLKKINTYNFAEIKIKKGYWNFPIIMETTLKTDK